MIVEKQQVGTRLPKPMVDEIDTLLVRGKYLNYADFLRAAARTEIEKQKES